MDGWPLESPKLVKIPADPQNLSRVHIPSVSNRWAETDGSYVNARGALCARRSMQRRREYSFRRAACRCHDLPIDLHGVLFTRLPTV